MTSDSEVKINGAIILFLALLIGVMAGYAWSNYHQGQGGEVKEMQLKKFTDYPEYDYVSCVDCKHRKTMCEPHSVICGTWLERVGDVRHAIFLREMRAVSGPAIDLTMGGST